MCPTTARHFPYRIQMIEYVVDEICRWTIVQAWSSPCGTFVRGVHFGSDRTTERIRECLRVHHYTVDSKHILMGGIYFSITLNSSRYDWTGKRWLPFRLRCVIIELNGKNVGLGSHIGTVSLQYNSEIRLDSYDPSRIVTITLISIRLWETERFKDAQNAKIYVLRYV